MAECLTSFSNYKDQMQVYLDKMAKQEEATEDCRKCGNKFKKSEMMPG